MPSESKMPALFIGHGSPENAYFDNDFTRCLERLGRELPRPKAVLCVSAHWLTRGVFVSTATKPETIHDFGGFPEPLYRIRYPAMGAPAVAKKVAKLIRKPIIAQDEDRGLDHGAWVVLKHIYPDADVPVFQMSIDFYRPPRFHYELGKQLAPLRKEGILIIGSGNIVHNLGILNYDDINARPFDWAVRFDSMVKERIDGNRHEELINYEKWGEISRTAHPTPDHYYPLLYAIALREEGEGVSYPFEGFHYASLSMRAVKIG